MRKLIKEILVIGVLATVILGGFVSYINKPMSTEEKLIDRIAYQEMLLKNKEGGIATYGDELQLVKEQIAELRLQLANENFKKRHNN